MQRTTAIEFYLRTCYGKLGCFCLILMSELKNISLSVVSTVDEYFFYHFLFFVCVRCWREIKTLREYQGYVNTQLKLTIKRY